MQFRRLSLGCSELIVGALCGGVLLGCSDDTKAASGNTDAAAEHAGEHAGEASTSKSSTKASDNQVGVNHADAGHDAAAADSGKSPQSDKQADKQAESPNDSGAPSGKDSKKDTVAKAPSKASEHTDAGAESMKVSVRFQAKLGKNDFACSHKYPSQGTANTTVTPGDLRLFVHALELIKEDGSKVAVTLNVREPWQSESLVLLDFEDNTGRCAGGTQGTNTAITGTVAPGSYKGIRFSVGVPEELVHKDQAGAPEPLKSAAGLGPQGIEGFRFAKIALQQLAAAGDPTGSGLFELGSTQCTAAMTGSDVKCEKANRGSVELAAFDMEKNTVVIDVAALFSTFDLSQANQCHATEKVCAPMFNALGIDFASGQAKSGQTLFRVE